ncbi:hypothetical protein BU16DRAFT_449263 [Lophium mytilinum]|uniref:Arrestin C-terminal-like domain-containing protein n=1 Tax=Lophium mytilinum TaxID=390894 RepID=A0A6A6RDM1_9PEZI|nr:hypothetical protein BU16DRAFT_449263 [Lophium mytilinum]
MNAPLWSTKARPLSDIRELTEPSLVEIPRKPLPESSIVRKTSLSRNQSVRSVRSVRSNRRPSTDSHSAENRKPDAKEAENRGQESVGSANRGRASPQSPPLGADNTYSSVYSIPRSSVPPRSSSQPRRSTSRRRQNPALTESPAIRGTPSIPALPPPRESGNTIPARGHTNSPVRQIAARLDPVSCDTTRRVPSRTFIREPLTADVLEFPTHRHPRVALELELSAGLFVGGSCVEGTIQITVDDAVRVRHRRPLDIARISVDLVGVEEMTANRRATFLNLATELIDSEHPPPYSMVESQEQVAHDDPFWHLISSTTNVPFLLSLPLDVGPPPFQSKSARIRYMLCVTLLIREQMKQYVVRTSEDIMVLSVYDPEKALMSLPSPLTASDEYSRPRDSNIEGIKVTAGLHRQVWVSGTSIYVDVHVANNSRKNIKRIELQLERDILCYKHAAASTAEKSASQARIFDSNERSILSKSSIKQGTAGWNGIAAHTTHIRTCDLELPRGHATVKCGKFFEVRYFLNVIVSSAHTKLVTVQLPIVLIHMNSLDVVPNSVAQVAAAIEEKRYHQNFPKNQQSPGQLERRPSHHSVQGRAWNAPRMQSLERMRKQAEDIEELGQILDNSPRKFGTTRHAFNYHTPPSNRKGRVLEGGDAEEVKRRLRHVRSSETVASKKTVKRGFSLRGRRTGAGSALGFFREAEVREDMDLGGVTLGGDGSFQSRLEAARERQYQFKKKKSVERWKGMGWIKGGGGDKDKDKDKPESWI